MATPHPRPSAAPDQPLDITSDWEYEYDDHETEDIYFTLDLTTHVPNAIQEKQYAKNGKLIGLAAAEKNAAASKGAPATDGQANGHAVEVDDTTNEANGDNNTNTDQPADSGKLQVLDLHTAKPYVKFNNGFYSCQWFTDLGTQFWITDAKAVSDPKFSGHVLDVVGSSQTRLVAKPASLKRKRDAVEPEPVASENLPHPVDLIEDDASDVSDADSRSQPFDQDPNEPMVIPRHKIKDPHLEAQANFMERLSAIKLRKGEKDAHSIPLRMPVYYKGAHNADVLRASSHAAKSMKDPPTQIHPIPRPPSKSNGAAPTVGESNPTNTEGAAPQEEPLITSLFPTKSTRRSNRGGNRGGTPSHAARRANLGLEVTAEQAVPQPPPIRTKKRGRPSNAERARRKLEAEQLASDFVLDPQLAGGETDPAQPQAQPGAEQVEANNKNDNDDDDDDDDDDDGTGTGSLSAHSVSREVSAAASSTQGDQPRPRKGRRSKAQIEEGRRLDEERKAKLASAAKAGARRESGADLASGERRRSSRRKEMEMSLDGAADKVGGGDGGGGGDGEEDDGQVDGQGAGDVGGE